MWDIGASGFVFSVQRIYYDRATNNIRFVEADGSGRAAHKIDSFSIVGP